MRMPNVLLSRFTLIFLMSFGIVFVCIATSAEKSAEGKDLAAAFLSRFLPGWTFGGAVNLEMDAPLGKSGLGEATKISLSFKNGQFSNPQGTAMGEGLQGTLVIRIGEVKGDSRSGQATLSISAGEALVDRYYLNLSLRPLKIDLRGRLPAKGLRPVEFRGTLEWHGLIRASWTGRASDAEGGRRVRLHTDIRIPSHDALFRLLAAETSAEPGPDAITVQGRSEMSMDVEIEGPRTALKGRLRVWEAGLSMPAKGIRVEGLSGDIPMDLSLKGTNRAGRSSASPPEQGEIHIEKIGSPFGDWQDVRVPLWSRSNELGLAEALVLPLFEGRISLQKLRCRWDFPALPDLEAALEIEGLDLAALSAKLTPFEIEGKLNGSFPRLIIKNGEVQTGGQVRLNLWDGYIQLMNFVGEDMYSRQRRWGFDARLQDLNLEEATHSLEFGQMGGLLDGEVKEMVFSFGQPESFELWLHNDPESGVHQYVDAKAVESLSILSSGVQAPLLPFFKYYPYSELGIYCKLENDVFTLRGTIHDDGKEYLVKRGFLRGLNVINRNPHNRIPWRDMLQRVRRVIPEEGQKIKVQVGSE
jgi:hypothetical protein